MLSIKAEDMRATSEASNQIATDNLRQLIEKLIKDEAKEGGSSICTMALPLKLINELKDAGFVVEVSKLCGTNKEITRIMW